MLKTIVKYSKIDKNATFLEWFNKFLTLKNKILYVKIFTYLKYGVRV